MEAYNQARIQVSMFGGGNTHWWENIFVFITCLKQFFLGTITFGGTKMWRDIAPVTTGVHIAPQYIDKLKRMCWITFTIFALPSLSSFTCMNLDFEIVFFFTFLRSQIGKTHRKFGAVSNDKSIYMTHK